MVWWVGVYHGGWFGGSMGMMEVWPHKTGPNTFLMDGLMLTVWLPYVRHKQRQRAEGAVFCFFWCVPLFYGMDFLWLACLSLRISWQLLLVNHRPSIHVKSITYIKWDMYHIRTRYIYWEIGISQIYINWDIITDVKDINGKSQISSGRRRYQTRMGLGVLA